MNFMLYILLLESCTLCVPVLLNALNSTQSISIVGDTQRTTLYIDDESQNMIRSNVIGIIIVVPSRLLLGLIW